MSRGILGFFLNFFGGIILFTPVDYIRSFCELHKIPISKVEAACGFSNGYLNPKKLKKIPYDRALKISAYLNVPIDYLLDKADIFDYPEDVSKKMCADIAAALKSEKCDVTFIIPSEITEQIENGTYIFDNTTYPQFSILTGKSAEDYFPSTENEKSPTDPKVDEANIDDFINGLTPAQMVEVMSKVANRLKERGLE